MSHNQITICIPKIKTFYRLLKDFEFEEDVMPICSPRPIETLIKYPDFIRLIQQHYHPYSYTSNLYSIWVSIGEDWRQDNPKPYTFVIPKGKIFKIKKIQLSPYKDAISLSFAKKNNGPNFSLVMDTTSDYFNGMEIEEV